MSYTNVLKGVESGVVYNFGPGAGPHIPRSLPIARGTSGITLRPSPFPTNRNGRTLYPAALMDFN